jgi:predicted acetyltransferase
MKLSSQVHLANIEVRSALPEERPVLANLLEIYSHDFSEFIDLRLQPDGRFGYPRLPLYWIEEDRQPFLVRVGGEIAGCVLVARKGHTPGNQRIWDIAEFFIVRGHRRRGVGTAVAAMVWSRFPGPWEVRVVESNVPAQAFWRAAIRAYTSTDAHETSAVLQEQRWHVFSFVSLSAPAA